MSDDDVILATSALTKRFGGFTAVNDVHLEVRRGTIHALIGPNGAGKTTCFNLLTKFVQPTSGSIRFKGRDITGMRAADIARQGLVRSFQISAVFPRLTALENVRIALQRRRGDSFDFWRSERALAHYDAEAMARLDDVGLTAFAETPAGELPYGRKRALEIATTLALEPEVLLLDEPMAGMGQEDVGRISALIKRISANRTILMVEHNLSVVADLSDRITPAGRCSPRGVRRGLQRSARGRGLYRGRPWLRRRRRRRRPARPLLGVRELNGWYDESHVLHGVTFRGGGRRGGDAAGPQRRRQATTLKAIMGILARREGSIVFEGRELIGLPARAIARAGIAYCPEERHLRLALGRGEPDAAAACPRRRADARRGAEALPQPGGAARQPGQLAVGRRAADARHRPHPQDRRDAAARWTSRPKGSPR